MILKVLIRFNISSKTNSYKKDLATEIEITLTSCSFEIHPNFIVLLCYFKLISYTFYDKGNSNLRTLLHNKEAIVIQTQCKYI